MPAIANQEIGPVYRGSDVLFTFTEAPVVDISAWTISFRLKQKISDGSPTLGPISATIISGPAGTFSIALTAAQTTTLPEGQYKWDVWRTDSGSANPLTYGTLTVLGTVKTP